MNILEIIHNKAVRDNIPDIISSSGRKVDYKILSDSDFLIELEKKIIEEYEEYMESRSIEELADLLEVIYCIGELKGFDKDKMEEIRKEKENARGSFKNNVFLIKTY